MLSFTIGRIFVNCIYFSAKVKNMWLWQTHNLNYFGFSFCHIVSWQLNLFDTSILLYILNTLLSATHVKGATSFFCLLLLCMIYPS